MDKTKSSYLSHTDVLQDLSPKEIDDVGYNTRMINYSAGHLFYMPDDPGEVMFILKAGRVQLYRLSTDGRKLVVAIMQPGAIFGHMALIGQGLHNTYAQALDDCTICVWNRESVENIIRDKPQVALRFLNAVGQRLSQAEERLTEITFKHIPARLAGLLLRLSAENGNITELKGFTHQYLADMLGTYRETVTQTLNDFKSQNLVEVSRKRIQILDLSGLGEIAEV
ncbi:MAG: Crp/Fnr family transcriptional regulator [Anaerolineae bacterium]|nr:Crp/Fnr family transcriptional regulator [Anaerolineae bacterium]MDQ7033729.1 Crp/Fnr family transcriptional regulator [Anaerolineae bacterium]